MPVPLPAQAVNQFQSHHQPKASARTHRSNHLLRGHRQHLPETHTCTCSIASTTAELVPKPALAPKSPPATALKPVPVPTPKPAPEPAPVHVPAPIRVPAPVPVPKPAPKHQPRSQRLLLLRSHHQNLLKS